MALIQVRREDFDICNKWLAEHCEQYEYTDYNKMFQASHRDSAFFEVMDNEVCVLFALVFTCTVYK
jgi:hypothetical protein